MKVWRRLTWRRVLVDIIAVCALLALLTWTLEGDMEKEFVLGTGLGAAAIALLYFYVDHRHGSRRPQG